MRVLDFIRFMGRVWIPEKLPPAAATVSRHPNSASSLRTLFARETLPTIDSQSTEAPESFGLRALFATETLPPPREAALRPRSLLRFILTREKLPAGPTSSAEME